MMLKNSADTIEFLSSLLLPAPVTATSAAPPGRRPHDEGSTSYILDLSHRIRVFMHLFRGLVASLTCPLVGMIGAGNTNIVVPDTIESVILKRIVGTLSSLIFAVTSMFQHLQGLIGERSLTTNSTNTRSMALKATVKAAKSAVPPLLVAVTLLDELQKNESIKGGTITFPSSDCSDGDAGNKRSRSASDASWVDVTPSPTPSYVTSPVFNAADVGTENGSTIERYRKILLRNREELMRAAGTLVWRAMLSGGGEASTMIWRLIISTLVSHCKPVGEVSIAEQELQSSDESSFLSSSNAMNPVVHSLLCNLAAIVLTNITFIQRDMNWSNNVLLCSATARLCDLLEEKELLKVGSPTPTIGSARPTLDQVRLLRAVLDVMSIGREQAGWCQLVLPIVPVNSGNSGMDELISPPLSAKDQVQLPAVKEPQNSLETEVSEETTQPSMLTRMGSIVPEGVLAQTYDLYHQSESFIDSSLSFMSSQSNEMAQLEINHGISRAIDSNSSSKMLLPILQPSFRIALICLGQVHTLSKVLVEELRLTLIAAIVGLSFPNSRDACLQSLSSLRHAIQYHLSVEDTDAACSCRSLVGTVIEEMKVRYQNERKKRDAAVVRAYESHSPGNNRSLPAEETISFANDASIASQRSLGEQEAANAREVEFLLLGNALGTDADVNQNKISSMNSRTRSESDDFILFPSNQSKYKDEVHDNDNNKTTIMGWSNYKGE